jgi:hypothetical protein
MTNLHGITTRYDLLQKNLQMIPNYMAANLLRKEQLKKNSVA